MRADKAQLRTTNEFQRSNSTTNAFIGGTKKPWMTGESLELARDQSFPKVSKSKVPDQASTASTASHRAELVPEVSEAVKITDLANSAIGPDFDRGRYPAQRSRQGGTKNHASRPLTNPAAGSTPPALSPPTLEENPYTPPAMPMDVSTNAENVLPSPSPSVDARQNSVNMIEMEGEGPQPQVADASPVEASPATLEELVTRCGGMDQIQRLLNDAGKSSYGPSQIAASAVLPELPGAKPSNGPRQPGQSPSATNQPRSESNQNVAARPTANKRPQTVTDEPRKRLQSLPSSSSEVAFGTPPANTVLSSQHGQSSAAVSTSGVEMGPSSQILIQRLAQRTQLVASLPDREGSHIERPRLGLLRDACENSDHFYLVLHQLFCFDHEVQRSEGQMVGLNDIHRQGLSVVTFLLVSNGKMTEDAVKWFSTFPLPLGDLITLRPDFASAHAKVLRCLEKMAMFWKDMRAQCTNRAYPPLVDELIVLFNVESFLFQQIIFRAVLRDIWSGQPDDCFAITEQVFNRDYKEVMSRLLYGSIPVGLVTQYQQAVVKEYQRVMVFHQQHTAAGPTASMAPPLQQQSQSPLTPANHYSNNRTMSQPQHNKNTQSLTLDLQAAQRHCLSATSGPSPIAIQAAQTCRQGNLLNQSQSLASSTFPSPQGNNFTTQSPTTLQGFSSPGISINSPRQWNGQQPQRERRTSSAAGNPSNTPQSMTPAQRTPYIAPSYVSGNPNIHQVQQNAGLQQQSHRRVSSSSIANPRPRPQSEGRSSLSYQASETSLAALSAHPTLLSSPSLPNHVDCTPFIRSYPPLPSHPNPTTSALHQAHLRSPILSYFQLNENPSGVTKCYRFIKHVLMPPEELDSKNRHVNWDFSVSKELTDWFARDCPSSHGAPPNRAVVPGSRLCRIRCISLQNKAGMPPMPPMPTQSEWAVADNVWPGSTAVVLNGIALDIRKKSHHGKDLPIDVTSYIKAGQNNLSTAVIGFPKDSTTRYAIGVEFIQVVDEQNIKNEIKALPWFDARKRILDQSKSVDPDIEVVQSQKVLDLTDPFTARIFDVPLRGSNCQHNQCFDRDTFLQTRAAKVPGEPCGPDEFRCPICGQDARPQSLMIDMFFVGVHMALKESGRLDAKAIILHDSGEWEIKEEERPTGESGDGTGKRNGERTASVSAARQSAPREVIELDDD